MKKDINIIKDMNLLVFSSLIILTIIILGIFFSSNILKEETIKNQLTITKLNSEYLSETLNQNINNIEILMENVSLNIKLNENIKKNNERLRNSINKLPQIRSINILNNHKIIYSSNDLNVGLKILENDFYPKSLFTENILKISSPWIGRDFNSGINVFNEKKTEKTDLSFIPIMKDIYINENKISIIINLNNDYFLNIFNERSENKRFEIELLRLDNLLLLSNIEKVTLNKKTKVNTFFDKAIQLNKHSGIQLRNNIKYISSYFLTKDYSFAIGVHLDYEKSLLSWKQKSYKFYIISIGIVAICIIITLFYILLLKREKEKEIALQKQQIEEHEKFKHLFQNSHFLGALLDKDGKILDINNKGLDFLNESFNNLQNTYFYDLKCWEIKENAFIKQLFDDNSCLINISQEINSLNKFNEKSIIDFNIYPINKENNYKYIALGQDITQKKEKEKKLTQAYTVFNNTRDGIVITDKNTNILDVNKAFEQITGYSKYEVINKTPQILKSGIYNKEFYNTMWSNLIKNGYWEGEITNKTKDKNSFTELLTINTIYDKNNNVVNYIGIFSDITDTKNKELLLKEKEKLLFQQSKMASMGEMIENISHQWRQPLSVISTSATGMLLHKELGILKPEDEVKNLTLINNTAQYLSNTIEDFRNFFKTNKKLEKFDLKQSAEAAIKLLSSKLNNKNIIIINEMENIFIYGLKNEFMQVIINIINNAKDALEEANLENKYIFINTFIEKNHIVINIKDNAKGIPIKIIDKIFEPYFTTKHQSQGTGIGLYMSEEIIRNHMMGEITVKNVKFEYEKEEYTGACFKIKLPINQTSNNVNEQ